MKAGPHPSLPFPTHLFTSMVQDWLTRYGYLPPPHPAQAQLQNPAKLRDAIKVMQRFAGLPETGVLGRWPPAPSQSCLCTQLDHYPAVLKPWHAPESCMGAMKMLIAVHNPRGSQAFFFQ